MQQGPGTDSSEATTRTTGALRVAVDTGGTFTDVAVARPDGSVFVWKVSSSPSSPDEAVIEGVVGALAELAESPVRIERFVHGTTVATNALITRTGSRVGLVTTAGFRDLLVDVHTIGAGGGSIAWRDSGGGLRVGPQSAGATPGPICYGRGGADITVTDAHLLLGRLGDSLLGGRLMLDRAPPEPGWPSSPPNWDSNRTRPPRVCCG